MWGDWAACGVKLTRLDKCIEHPRWRAEFKRRTRGFTSNLKAIRRWEVPLRSALRIRTYFSDRTALCTAS